MIASLVLSVLIKTTLFLACALVGVRAARRARASMRHFVLASTFAVLVVLPFLAIIAPPVTVAIIDPHPLMMPATFGPATPIARAEGRSPIGNRAAAPSAPEMPINAFDMLAVMWALGALLFLAPIALTPCRSRDFERTGRAWPAGETIARRLAAEAGVTRAVTLLVHDGVASPLTCGLARPRVVLPADALEWHEADLRCALVHELEHVRRADWPVHVAARLVCALYWFHPLVWVAWRQLALESERACDDAVLRHTDGTRYAQQLLTLARRQARRPPVPALAMAARTDLSTRIAALLDKSQVRGRLGVARMLVIAGLVAAVGGVLGPLRATAQQDRTDALNAARPSRPSFEVASVRRNTSGSDEGYLQRKGSQFTTTNFPLRNLILSAYRLQPFQLVDQPAWIESARFDIVATMGDGVVGAPPGAPPGPQELMLQTLLEERFKLRVRTENREIPIYALVLARRDGSLGPGLRRAAVDCSPYRNAATRGEKVASPPPRAPGRPACGMTGTLGGFFAGGVTLRMVASTLSTPTGRVVEDRTGLTGEFDVDLEFAADPLGAATPTVDAAPTSSNRPSLFTAIEEQLGLRLQPDRSLTEVLVIDQIEWPGDN